MSKGKKIKMVKAAPIKRLIAYGIDWYLSALCMSFSVIVMTSIERNELVIENLISNLNRVNAFIALLFGLFLSVMYFLIPELLMKDKHAGQTIGKMIMKIKVIQADGSPVSLKILFIRYFIGLILIEQTLNSASFALRTFLSMTAGNDLAQLIYNLGLAITFLSLVLMFVRPEAQMLHDIIAKTKVVEMN